MTITSQNPQINPPGKVSETQRLTAESDRLSHAVDSWNSWYVGLGVAALIVAFLVFFAQWRIIRKSKELSSVQSDLIAAKDRQAAADSKDQDERIAAAQNKAAESNEAAGKANERAANAEKDAGQANERAAKAQGSLALAEQHSAEANAKAEGFRLDIANANARAAAANETAERERFARLQLEARLADRVVSPDQQNRIKEACAPLKGKTVGVLTFGDSPEINRTANAILQGMHEAGVLFTFFHPLSGGGAQGVVVGIPPDAPKEIREAGEKLVSILSETLGGGVGQGDFDKMVPNTSGTGGNTPGADTSGKPALRIQIAPK